MTTFYGYYRNGCLYRIEQGYYCPITKYIVDEEDLLYNKVYLFEDVDDYTIKMIGEYTEVSTMDTWFESAERLDQINTIEYYNGESTFEWFDKENPLRLCKKYKITYFWYNGMSIITRAEKI
jgi:hypothetical protein